MEEVLYLANIASKVTLIHRRDKLRAEAMLVDKLNQRVNDGKIEIVWNATLNDVLGDKSKVTGVELNIKDSTDKKIIECSGVFVAIGHQPNTSLFKEYLDMDDSGYLKISGGSQGNSTETSVKGVFAAGEIFGFNLQTSNNISWLRCMAALDAEKYLDK